MSTIIRTIALVVLAFAAIGSVYFVDETEQVVVTQFGKAVGRPVTEPGLKFKLPWIQLATFFPKNIIEWDGQPGQVPTKDKTFIWVDVFARWRIVDALTYFEKVNNELSAQRKLDDIVDAAVRNVVTSHNLIEAVRTTDRQLPIAEDIFIDSVDSMQVDTMPTLDLVLGRSGMREAILAQARPKLQQFGIELVDLRFKRINYVNEVLRNVYERMIAERKQIAEKYRSEGRGESQKIIGRKERELKKIFSGAYRRSQEVKGEADAEATRTYSAAYNRDPEFYSFVKTLEVYRESLDSTAWALFSTNADILKYLKSYGAR